MQYIIYNISIFSIIKQCYTFVNTYETRCLFLHTKDLTQGNLYHHIISLSIPLLFGNILQQFYNTIDAFVIGRYAGHEEFAAIGIAGTIMNLFLFMIVGACTGLSVLFARFYGTKDYHALHQQHFTALVSGIVFSILLGLLGIFGMHTILTLIQTPDNLYIYTEQYLRWIFISLPAAFLYNMYAAALRASGDTAAALYILAAAVFTNLVLDIFFVAGLGIGIDGAAMATAFTQLVAAVLCILYLRHSHPEFIFSKKECHLRKTMLIHTLQCSFVTCLHQASLYIGKTMVQGTVNTAGTEVIAAYTAATRIEGYVNSFGDSVSASASILISQNNGSGQKARVKRAFHCSLRCSILLGICSVLILYNCAPAAVRLLVGQAHDTTISEAVKYLRLIALFYPLCYTGGTFTGYYNGMTKVIFTLIGTLGQITLRVFLSWYFFANMQLNAVALATGIGWACANLFWAICKIYSSRTPGNCSL